MIKNKKIKGFDWILLGLTLHSIGRTFFISSKIVCYVFCGLGLIFVFTNLLFRVGYKKPFQNIILYVYYFYLLWSIIIIFRPFFSDQSFNSDGFSLINGYTWLSYLTPIIVFIGFKQISLNSIFRFCIFQGVIGILILIKNFNIIFTNNLNVNSDNYEDIINIIDIPIQFLSISGFIILCYKFVSNKQLAIAFSFMFLSIFTVLFTARRSSVFMYVLILLFYFYVYMNDSSQKYKLFKFILVISSFVFLIGAFNNYINSYLTFFLSRLNEDTRSGMDESLLYSFRGQTSDWIVGRGLNGAYNCLICTNGSSRGEIETGYLYLILKGGIVNLFLFIFILAHSAYLGLFLTKNLLTKGMSLFLVAHIIYLVPYGLPSFSFEYLIVWICVLHCQSKQFRMYSNLNIKKYLMFK